MKTQLKAENVAWMVVVALLWSICFPFIVTGLPDAPPLLFAALRAFLAGGLLFAVHLVKRRREPYSFTPQDLGLLSLIGLSYTAMGLGGMFLGAGILFLASSVGGEQWDIRWTFRFTGSLLILSALATAAMVYLWFALLARAPLNRLNVFSFLTPVLGLLIGVMFFEERLQPVQILGIIVIIIGIAMMQGRSAVVAPDESAFPIKKNDQTKSSKRD